MRARWVERRVGGEGESASRVADTVPPAFALAYVGAGALLSVASGGGSGASGRACVGLAGGVRGDSAPWWRVRARPGVKLVL